MGVSEQEFLAASDRFEQAYMRKRPGFVRRTLLRGDSGEWAVLVDWDTAGECAGLDGRVPERSCLGALQCRARFGQVRDEALCG